jgi:hypothetical protein
MYDTHEEREYICSILGRTNIISSDGVVTAKLISDYDVTIDSLRGKTAALVQKFKFNKEKNVTIDGKEIHYFNANSEITVAYSKKYTKQAFIDLLKEYFEVDDERFCFYSDNNEYALILCKKSNKK